MSGEYYFGRGTADMKGGGAIQIALLERYSKIEDFKGNILLLSVPDKENLSAGMRGDISLLDELKEKYELNYLAAINSEPHQRIEKAKGVFSEGSVGKSMYFFYVRGLLAHAGKIFEGVNALNILSEIVRRTELNLDFSDFEGEQASPPSTWLYVKDRKTRYDVSMPLGAGGYLSVLSLYSEPEQIMDKLKDVSKQAFASVIQNMNENYMTENYFTGISDLSYTSVENSKIGNIVKDNMPHFGRLYDIPFDAIERTSMPGFNIGPWGKDFHKLTERVYRPDILDKTPRLLHKAIAILLGNI